MAMLVVDPSKVFRALWQRMATAAGHDSVTVAEGQQGLDLLRDRPFDLVCVALTLADLDGIEFSRRARAIPTAAPIPILLTTSTDDEATRRSAFDAGVTAIHPRTDVEQVLEYATRLLREAGVQPAGRILYVEDSATVATVMRRVLDDMRFTVDHFTSATEASAAFEQRHYDLVISDILVEGEMSGIDLVRRIREACPDRMRTPILAISGTQEQSHRIELFRLGVNDFVSKPVLDEEVRARVTNLVTNKQLIEQVDEQRRHLYQLAMTDPLTGLYNRNSLAEFADRAMAQADRHGIPVAVVLIDIDHFKQINDTHGHLVGDEVLSAIGELLLDSTRTEDFAVRFGGEELLVVLTHCGLEDAARHAERLREGIEALHPAGLDVTASVGVTARTGRGAGDFDGLLRTADEAVYAAKADGRNRVVTAAAPSG